MPLAVAWAIQSVVSAGVLLECLQVICPLLYEPITLVTVRPCITDRATRPCCAHIQIGVLPDLPWLSALNQAATPLSCFRSFTVRMPPPRLPTYTDCALFSLTVSCHRFHTSAI